MTGRSRWRYHFPSEDYSSCQGVQLDEGVLIWNKLPDKFAYIKSLVFTSNCQDGTPLYSSFVELEDECPYLPIVAFDWNSYINNDGYTGPVSYTHLDVYKRQAFFRYVYVWKMGDADWILRSMLFA